MIPLRLLVTLNMQFKITRKTEGIITKTTTKKERIIPICRNTDCCKLVSLSETIAAVVKPIHILRIRKEQIHQEVYFLNFLEKYACSSFKNFCILLPDSCIKEYGSF